MHHTNNAPASQHPARGFTLIETAMVLAITGVVMTAAVPSLSGLIDTRRLDGVASQVASDLQFARGEAVWRNQAVRMSFQADAATGSSCYVIHTGAADSCRCGASSPAQCEGAARQIKTVQLEAAQRVSLLSNVGSVLFDPLHGTASPAATLRVIGAQNREVRQVVNIMGRVRSCSPQAAVAGYRAC